MSKISLLRYNTDKLEELSNVMAAHITVSETETTWLEVVGVEDFSIIEQIGAQIGMHHLAIEDVISVKQRPKIDDYESGIFISLRTLDYSDQKIIDEQISIYICKNMVVSFSERASGIFEPLKERLRGKKGLLRNQGADFLAYAIIDTVVDNYFIALNKINTVIDNLESGLSDFHILQHLKDIHDIQRQIVSIRKSIWPVREVINHLLREEPETPLLTPITSFYLKDVYDHVVQVIETLDLMRDLGRGLQDIAISSMSYRMNEVIKILTIVSTIFVPLTFITSLYGMNFEYMPELKSKYGYIAVWSLMLGVALFMIRYFRRKKWI
ncbi:MAG: magnesium/cobalt transporter CorA [Chlamydiota bacterium]